ncbi:MAG: sigma-54 dependent transcriptional regulator [Desulforhopalus sp.]|nr:sigma-54 dependent transcriptional regulator [Desulforhopalus sp.]
MRKGKILVVDDDSDHLGMLRAMAKSLGHTVDCAIDGQDAVKKIQVKPVDLVLMDGCMAHLDTLEALRRIKDYNPTVPIIIMTDFSSVDTAVEAMKMGAYDYLTRPLNFEEMARIVNRAMNHLQFASENRILKEKIATDKGFHNLIGSSAAILQVVELARTAAPTEATILITGESGTGKEIFAKAIHANSSRKKGSLITVNCAALSETLLESELFGHEKGTFTGADRQRHGRFMQANHGTIFLDEITEIPLPMQSKILRAIQEREIQRLGSDEVLHVDIRIIAATNRNLEEEVRLGRFREDLYYRLNVVNIHIPPLRARMEDIPPLANHFLHKYMEKNRKELKGFTPMAMDILCKSPWPGNVRQLENVIERAVILSNSPSISDKELPEALTTSYHQHNENEGEILGLGGKSLKEIESKAIQETLEQTRGNKSEAAKRLNITRTTLNNKLRKYNPYR